MDKRVGMAFLIAIVVAIAEIMPAYSQVAPANYQGLWWASPAGSESGWGINFAHQGNTIFASWFTYDLSGKGMWLTMTAPQTASSTYSGTLYSTTGPAFDSVPFNPSAVVLTPVGNGTLAFGDVNDGTFAYTVNGISQTKNITREVFATLPNCSTATASLTAATNYQDLWWASPAGSESGWGINLNHEGDIIFATWFTYDVDGSPMWLTATAPENAPGVFSGTLYRTTGPAFNSTPFNPAAVVLTAVGTATFVFSDGNDANFSYTVNGISQTKAITRQVFQSPGTACQIPPPPVNAVETVTQTLTAAAGGTIALPSGSSVVIPPGVLAADQPVTLALLPMLPQAPPSPTVVGVGPALQLTASISSNTTLIVQFVIAGSLNTPATLQGSAALADVVDSDGTHNYFGVEGSYDSGTNSSSISVGTGLLSGSSEIIVAMQNLGSGVASTTETLSHAAATRRLPVLFPTPGVLDWNGSGWATYNPLNCPTGRVLVLVHGMLSSVQNAFGACVNAIESAGNYDDVVGFNYDWHLGIAQNGLQLRAFLDQLAACPNTQIDIEAHSEGGPVVASALTTNVVTVQPSTLSHIRNFVALGSPLLGTPAAYTQPLAQDLVPLLTGLYNRYGVPVQVPVQQLLDLLGGQYAPDLQPGSSVITSIKQGLSNPNFSPRVILECGTQPHFSQRVSSELSNIVFGGPFDDIVGLNSCSAKGIAFNNSPAPKAYAISHTDLTCNPDVVNDVASNLAGACPISLSPQSSSWSSNGGNANITVMTPSGCAWGATSSDPTWLSIYSENGNTITYFVAPNYGTTQRTATINVHPLTSGLSINTGQNFFVTEAGTSSPSGQVPVCSLAASNSTPAVNTNITLSAACTETPTSYSWTGCSSSTDTCTANSAAPGTLTYSVKATNASGTSVPVSISVTWESSFDGSYAGTFSGTVTTTNSSGSFPSPVSGPVMFAVSGQQVTVTEPIGGSATLSSGDQFTASANGTGGVAGLACIFSGSLSIDSLGNAIGSGTWTCSGTLANGYNSGSGTWTGVRQ